MKVVHVAVGAIVKDGRVLLAKRAAHQHQGGLWEFPGGKVEAGEDVQAALTRELQEELAITPTHCEPLIQIAHDYGDKSVLLDVLVVSRFTGEPTGVEGQPLCWVALNDLDSYAFPQANKPIIKALQLPKKVAITPSSGDLATLKEFVAKAIGNQFNGLQIRAPQLSAEETWQLYRHALDLTAHIERSVVWLNSCHITDGERLLLPVQQLEKVQAIHWQSGSSEHIQAQYLGRWDAMACHNLEELRTAEARQCACAILSPVAKTPSHPDATPLGWQAFGQVVAKAKIPVYALGGMAPADLPKAIGHYAQGIAGISSVFLNN